MSPSPHVPDVLDLEALNSSGPLTFPDLLDRLYQGKYTGALTLHFAGGVARAVVLSADPVKLPLDTGGRAGS